MSSPARVDLLFAPLGAPPARGAKPPPPAVAVDPARAAEAPPRPYKRFEAMCVLVDGVPVIPLSAREPPSVAGPPPPGPEPPLAEIRPLAKKEKPLPPAPARGPAFSGRTLAPEVSVYDVERFSAAEAAAFVAAAGGRLPPQTPAAQARALAMLAAGFESGYTLADLRAFLAARGERLPDKAKKAEAAARARAALGLPAA